MTKTQLYRFCNIAKTGILRSTTQYTTHYNNTPPPQSDVKLPTAMIQRNMHKELYNFKRCLNVCAKFAGSVTEIAFHSSGRISQSSWRRLASRELSITSVYCLRQEERR